MLVVASSGLVKTGGIGDEKRAIVHAIGNLATDEVESQENEDHADYSVT